MHLSSIQVLLLAVVAIMSTPRPALGQAAPDTCTAADVGKQFCSDCKTPSKCVSEDTAPVPQTPCKTGAACTVLLQTYAVCKPIAETPCSCGGKTKKCDPYDPTSVLICLSGGITAIQECQTTENKYGTCIDSVCGTTPPEATTVSLNELCANAGTGFVAVTPECTTAAYCDGTSSKGTTSPCGAMQYYDVDELECLPAPPLPCPASCNFGACNDKANCSKWYICENGIILAEETCEGDTPEYDTVNSECVAEGDGTCSKNNGCNFDLITTPLSTTSTSSTITSTTTPTTTSTTTSTKTTTTPPTTTTTTSSTKTSTTTPTTSTSSSTTSSSSSTTSTSTAAIRPATCSAANVGIRYPVAGSCKKYQSCRLVATNVYAYVETSCLGSLVFDAKTGFCDTLTNVPGCVPPS